MKNNNIYYDKFFNGSQEKIKFFYEEIKLPEDDCIHTLKEIIRELNFNELLKQYSNVGREATNPIMLFTLITYANAIGKRSLREIADGCKRDICFINICKGETPSKDAINRFKNDYMETSILDDLHYQFIQKVKELGYVSLEKLFVDGTKIEANANRYTFVWRGSINYHLCNLITSINKLYERYNSFIKDNKYDKEHNLKPYDLLVIQGIDKVEEIIVKNRQRKKDGKKKLSNNKVIQIDNIDIKTLRMLMFDLHMISEK